MKLLKPIDLQPTIDLVFKKDFKDALLHFTGEKNALRGDIPPLLKMDLDLIEAMLQSQIEVVPEAKVAEIRSWSETNWTEFESPINSIAIIMNAGVVLALAKDFKSAQNFFLICAREIGRFAAVAPAKYLLRNLYHLALINRFLKNGEEGFNLSKTANEIAQQTILNLYPTHPEGVMIAKLKNSYEDANFEFSLWFELGTVPIPLLPRS